MKSIIKNAMIIAGICSTAAVANAGQLDDVRIKYSDVQLGSEKGRAAIYRQIEGAAETACGSTDLRKAGSVRAVMKNRECASQVIDDMVSRIGNSKLTSMHHKGEARENQV